MSILASTNTWQTLTYDSLGNVTDNGPNQLWYDWANQPIGIAGPGISATNVYDGNLKRVKTIRNGKTTYWLYSALTGTPLFSNEISDAKTTIYASGGGTRLELSPGDVDFTYLNHQGSAVASYHTDGSYEWRQLYTPFGESAYSTRPGGDDPGYTGHIHDDVSGLTYMQARYYDPVIGRFLSTDPIGYQDQMNLYAYVHNDPLNATDPTGEFRVGVKVEGTAVVGGGGKFAVEVSVDFGSGEISADATVGQRAGLKGKASVGVFAEPSSKNGNSLSANISAIADASAEVKTPLGTAEASFGARQSTVEGETGFTGGVDASASANLGPVSIDNNGRGEISLGAGLGSSAGQDVNVNANFSIPDTAKAVKEVVGSVFSSNKVAEDPD